MNYKDGRTLIQHYCIELDCNNEICYPIWRYGSQKCKSCSHKNKHLTKETKEKIRLKALGRIGGFMGKHHSEISCKKMSKNHVDVSGKNNPNFGNHKLAGKNHFNWQGGISFEPYSIEFNDKLKDQIRKRDNYTCQNCNMTEEEHLIVVGYSLIVHHIDYDKENNDPENLITTCNWCNVRANYSREYWIKYFREIIDGKKYKF